MLLYSHCSWFSFVACSQAQQALVAAQQAAAAAPPKPVDGYVPTRFISDVFCTAEPATPSAAGVWALLFSSCFVWFQAPVSNVEMCTQLQQASIHCVWHR
jgi:hypothetical protein